MKADFATGWIPVTDDEKRFHKPAFFAGLARFWCSHQSRMNLPQPFLEFRYPDIQLVSLATNTGFFASSCIRGLSGFANKNRNDWTSRKPKGVVLVRGWHNVLTECSRDTQKAVQVSSEDFGVSSQPAKGWEFRRRHIVLRTNRQSPGKTMEHQQVDDWCVAKRPTD